MSNTFVGIAQASTLWEMVREAAPDMSVAFTHLRQVLAEPNEPGMIDRIYQTLRPVNFSADICTPLASRLRVLPVPEVGWSDWGSAERIVASLQRIGKLEACLAHWRRRGGEVLAEFPLPPPAQTSLTIRAFFMIP